MRKMRKFGVNGVVIATVVTVFVMTLTACYFLGGDKLVSALLEKDENRAFYFLCTEGVDDVTIAHQNADLIRYRGGAGYVDLKGGNRVILSVYPSEKSAQSVLEKLDDDSILMECVTTKNINLSLKDKSLKKQSENALTYFDIAFNGLYDMSNSLADNKMSVDDVKVQIGVLQGQIEDIKSVFYENTKNSSLDVITEIKLALVTCIAIVEGVEVTDYALTLSSLRRQTVQLVFCFQALSNTLS